MSSDSIIAEIKLKKYHPVYFLHGEEPYFIDVISDYMESNILSDEEKAFNQIILYGKDADFKAVVDEARQYPMMADHRVIIIKEAQDMKTLPELVTYIEKPSPHSILVICHKYKKLDKRTKFAKLLEEKAVVFESKKIYDNQVAAWVQAYTKDKGYTIEPKAAGMLSDYLGADLSKVSNELEKLFISVSASKMITTDLVKEQIGISKDFNVFELQTALGDKNFAKAHLIIRYFVDNPGGNPLIPVLSNLFVFFNKVFIAAYHSKEPDFILAKMLGLGNSFFLKEYRIAASNYSIPHLKKIFNSFKIAEKHSKGVDTRRSDDAAVYKDLLIVCMHP